eukprot:CAMPEP_0197931688 /NCGR_PEP_ID=MMETSP1439-20131203/107464_1 /TAXON_ID=66791 /ORGANISM="Gonyaulax spinifera, Strain CCMP409" /LENGTH=80 /DNA_ID=CAMNT_0043554433 /DNA_START=8 /DNA_END=246 /DNA_ORIENTATION=-
MASQRASIQRASISDWLMPSSSHISSNILWTSGGRSTCSATRSSSDPPDATADSASSSPGRQSSGSSRHVAGIPRPAAPP